MLVPGLEAGEEDATFDATLAEGNAVKWVSTKGKEKVAEDTRPLILQVMLAACCVAAALSGFFVILSVQAAASGASAGILSSKFLCEAAAALSMSIA